MKKWTYLSGSTAAILAAVALAPAAIAQQTTSEIRGQVTGMDGVPVSGASVVVIDGRTSAARTATTGTNGRFSLRNLTTGGPYSVTATAPNLQGQTLENISLNLQSSADLTFALETVSDERTLDAVVVTASQAGLSQLAVGPGVSFNQETLEGFPSISRDIRDIIRFDPRVSINENNEDSISCLGGNNRFNSFTVDGVRSSDNFGLNASGFPNRNSLPIPFDSIRETSVEFSPFDVTYGQFTGCNINVVTKSGSNDVHGSAFFVYNNDNLTGDTLNGITVTDTPFDDFNWGATLSGPIIKDRLFFFFAYEEVEDGGNFANDGPAELGFVNPIATSLAEINLISDILASEYGFDTGGIATTLPETNRRFLGRIDWQINNDHRAEFTYSRIDEAFVSSEDIPFVADFIFANTFLLEGTQSNSYSGRLFSDWTDKLSTDIRFSRVDLQDLQDPVGGGEAQDAVPIPRFLVTTSAGEPVLNGPGEFRAANDLQTTTDQFRFKADYRTGNHTITAGYELDRNDVFNLFSPNATGLFEFASVADLQNRLATDISGAGSFSGDINDAAANFQRNIHSLYLQDEWQITPDLTLTGGIRYDWYQSGDTPPESQAFIDRYGFSNSTGFNDLDAIQPRVGFNYNTPARFGDTTFRGGIGLFSGGDPTVWFSNAYTNFGFALGNVESGGGACTPADLTVPGASGSFGGLPQCILDQQQAEALAGQGRTDAIDPNFKVPRVLRSSIGFTHITDFGGGLPRFFDDWTFQSDFIYTKQIDSADFVDLTLSPVGTAPDGRSLFNAIDPLLAGCDATFVGPRAGFTGPAAQLAQGGACDAGGDDQDILLTNSIGEDGRTYNVSAQFSKQFEFTTPGINKPGSFFIAAGYSWTDAEDVNPTNSSTATSNFEEVALENINRPVLAPGQFFNEHNITLAATFEQEFFDGFASRFSMFYGGQSGRRFSYVYDNNTPTTLFGDSDNEERNLFYVPNGPNDPRVTYATNFDVDAFFAFLEESGLNEFAGQVTPRNTFEQPWFHDLDLRIAQDIPLPGLGRFLPSHNLEVFMDIENFLNLINDDRNILRLADVGDVTEGVPVLDAALSADGTQYIYSNFNPGDGNFFASDRAGGQTVFSDRNLGASLWAIQFGVRFEF